MQKYGTWSGEAPPDADAEAGTGPGVEMCSLLHSRTVMAYVAGSRIDGFVSSFCQDLVCESQ